ncbi:hypothetical protein LCGC14_1881620 [marine sediment metagenome]|uniref:Uncharacterized protein n=1 Tax=marine sediment metagenome TaxID=412755 RepID=A0A0F9GQC5_9ZZZZ
MDYEKMCKRYFELKGHFLKRERHSTQKSLSASEQDIKDKQKVLDKHGAEWFYFEHLQDFDFGDKYYDELYPSNTTAGTSVIPD